MKYVRTLLSSILTTLILGTTLSVHASPTATLSLTPSTRTVNQGATTELTIQVQAGSQKVTGVQACIQYDHAQLSLVNTDTSASPLTYTTPNSNLDCTDGETQVSRFGVTHPTGTFTIGVLTFKALTAATNTTVSLDKVTSYVKDDSTTDASGNYANILSSTNSSAIKLLAVPAADASSNPASPAGNTSNSPALSGACSTNTNAQATSRDVEAKCRQSAQAKASIDAKATNPQRDLCIVIGAFVSLVIATLVLRKLVGSPTISTNTQTADSKNKHKEDNDV